MKKSTKIMIIVSVALLLSPFILVFAMNAFAWSAIFFGLLFSPDPPAPEITYAEFPFEIVYEIDGEITTVNDVYVCAYDGVGMNEGVGKYRKWKGYVKSTGEADLILLEDGDLKLACSPGAPKYYMSDPEPPDTPYTPHIYYIRTNDVIGGTEAGILDIEELLEKYKIRLVSWELSEPVQNSFD